MDQSKRPQKYELLGGRNREGKHTGLLGYADGMGKTLLTLLLATMVGNGFQMLGFTEANIITVYILGVLIVSIITTNQLCSLLASVGSVLIFNFFFTAPRFTFHFQDNSYPVTFCIMFIASILTGTLASRLKENARLSAEAAYRTQILLDTNRLLQKEQDAQSVISATAEQVVKLLKRDIVMYLAQEEQLAEPGLYRAAEAEALRMETKPEQHVADWVFHNNQPAGAATDTLSNAACLYLPIHISQRVYGVIGIAMDEHPLDSFENSVLLSILGECALALENIRNAKEKEEAAILAKNEQLRANLLRAISHDLRTPLTSISGNASNLISNYRKMDDDSRAQIFQDIYDDSMWLISLVENLLAVTRLEEDRVHLNQSAELMDEVIAEALQHVNRRRSEHPIHVIGTDELILAQMDARLIVQVIINMIDNAIKYTPAGSSIEIRTQQRDSMVEVSIADHGPGIPEEQKAHVFDMFYSGANTIADSRRSLGLGLYLCKTIITAHGGIISVSDNQPHGTVFTFTLPVGKVELHE